MIFRIVAAAVVILALMVLIKDGRVLRNAGIVGSCSVVQKASDGTEWAACRPGRLEGKPDLSKRSCTRVGANGDLDYWRCPSQVDAGSIR